MLSIIILIIDSLCPPCPAQENNDSIQHPIAAQNTHHPIVPGHYPKFNLFFQARPSNYQVSPSAYFSGGVIVPYVGELLALATVLCWSISVQFFEAASRRIGPVPVNIIRIGVALLLFGTVLSVRNGSPIPLDFPLHGWIYLSLSGIVGFFIGDIFLFKALVDLGPRLAMLIYSLSAPTAAVIGWLVLSEHYLPAQWLGILITISGVCLVIMERTPDRAAPGRLHVRNVSIRGFTYGILAMLSQAVGYLLSKVGMMTGSGYLDAFSSTQIRAIAAFICLCLYFSLTGKWGHVRKAAADVRALAYTSMGAVVGPFLGVSLSLLILHYLTAGVAATFLSLVPIFMIPFAVFLHKEHVSFRAILGTVIAIFGIYLLMH
jgi:drug/metabolite transporter (DMT)-like permease